MKATRKMLFKFIESVGETHEKPLYLREDLESYDVST